MKSLAIESCIPKMKADEFLRFMEDPKSKARIVEEYQSKFMKEGEEMKSTLEQSEEVQITGCLSYLQFLYYGPQPKKNQVIPRASFVDGYDTKHKFLCTKKPAAEDFETFWQTVWSNHVEIIVMIGKLTESYQYWSPERRSVVSGKFKITTRKVTVYSFFTATVLSLTSMTLKPKQKRLVFHYQYTDWPKGDAMNANYRSSTERPIDQRTIIQYLNCSDLQKYSLSSDVIQLNDTIVVNSDNPCIINAPTIILKNNKFLGDKHAFNITGKKIVMVNNKFEGPEQNHYIVGDSVLLTNNKYEGDVQIHEVAGYEVTAFNNVYEGRYRVNQYAGTNILVIDNESKGSPFDVVLEENDPNFMHRLYFTTERLLDELEKKGLRGTGTIMKNRIPADVRPLLVGDRELKNNGRGSNQVSVRNDGKMAFTKWYDKVAAPVVITEISNSFDSDGAILRAIDSNQNLGLNDEPIITESNNNLDVVKPRSATGSLTRTKPQLTPVIDERAETADTEIRSSHDSVFSPLPSPNHQDDNESSLPSTSRMSISQPTPQQIKRRKKQLMTKFCT
ncbi:unnamed protein product [Colias eurytheme]|nr:unnamed protein product [Colias eurytheme]